MFEKMKFSGTWRSYQQKVLDNLQRHLYDEKLHIVAAPGAGKTILGLEVIRRIGKPCLILAPTITIKNQWELRLKQAFLTDPDVADELVSTDILSPKVITISTYQGLLAGLCGCKEDAKKDLKDDTTDDTKDDVSELCDDEEEKTDNSRTLSRINVEKANNLINELKSKKIDLLCFDEAHHLRKEWWKALDFIMKNLKPATTLSLTATPPFDVDLNEWNRYEELCGPVDESISIPELVKNGDLCPHQDLVYFSPLRAEEEKSYEIYQQNAEAFYMYFLSDKNFANEAVKLQIWENPRKHLGLIYDDPSFFIAFASYLIYHNLSISKVFYDLFDTKKEKIPEFNLAFAEKLLNKLMFEYREYFPSLNYYIEEFYLQAQKRHLIFNRTLYLSGNPKLTKEMARSLGKLDAIENIVVSECSQLKEKLRLVILADYIKADAFSSQVESLGVIPIFIRLANMGLKGFSLAVLTGKIILIPKEAKEQLIKLITDAGMQSKDIGFKVSKYFPDYLELKPKESVKSKVVHWVTKLFNDGNINILVGTQSLLGEGWDAPAVNSLILSSTVASYMLSNQMRGRAIRTEKGNPDKVSHIWHLVSARTYNLSDELSALMSGYILQKDEADFEKVRKRFDGYEAPSLNSPYDIQNGIERCLSDKLINFYKKLSNKNYLNEWNRYEELCGPVDESISIPELVKNGDLCPHQDLVYFSPLRAEEEKSYEIYQQNAEAFYMYFLSDKNFANEAVKLQIWENPRKHLGLIYDDPSFFIAFASYLIYHNLSISKVFYDLFDTKKEKIPEFNLAFAEKLLNKLMFEYREYFPSLNYYIEEFYLQAQKRHLIFNRTLYLSGNPKLTKEMARSLGKLDAIENIVVSECSQLKEKLRLVILADYIKADAFSSQVESLGVIPIFIRLANMGLKGFSLAVLTGKIILIPKEAKEQLIKLITDAGMQSKDIGFKVSKYFPDYLELKPKESVKSKVVHWVTKLFNDGNINILVGTQSLLGEGWDAPAVNSLILSSTVASYMLSNQMRGRAIRTEKGNPDKVSHIWHLVSARTYNLSDELSALMSGYILQKDEADFEKVRKRFDGYEAPSLNSPYDIQNGIERCLSDKLINFYKKLSNKNYLNELTQKMLSYKRIETKEAWKEGLCKGFGMGVGRLKIGLESQKIRFKTFSYIDGYMAKLTSAGAVAYAFLHASGGNKYNNWNPVLMWWVVLGFVTYMLPSTIRVLRTGKPEGILKQISMVILETLFEANIISTNPKMSSLEVNKIADGYYVSAGALSQRDNNIFIQSLQEFLDPIENPRYLLIRKNPILYFLKQVDYYAIPSIIGLNKKNVMLFKEIWKRRIGYCNIIYTRTEIGRDVLLKARVRAYSNLQNKTKKLNRWE